MFQSLISLLHFLIIVFVSLAVSSPVLATNSPQIGSGLEHLSQGNYEEARLRFDEILRADSQHLQARQYRCFAHLNLEKYESAIADCSLVIEAKPNELEAYLWRGLAYYRRANYQEAIHNYNQILKQNPDHPQALYNRGLAQSAIAQLDEALADYNQALQLSEGLSEQEKATIYNDRGIVFLQQNQYKKARKDFSQAIQLDQNDSRSLYNLGCVCHYLGEHQTAIKHFTQSLEKAPNNASAYISRGLAFYQLDYTESAIADLKLGANLLKSQGKSQAEKEIRHLILHLQPLTPALNSV